MGADMLEAMLNSIFMAGIEKQTDTAQSEENAEDKA